MGYAICPDCGRKVRRISTPLIDPDNGRKLFWQHQDDDDPMVWWYRCPAT